MLCLFSMESENNIASVNQGCKKRTVADGEKAMGGWLYCSIMDELKNRSATNVEDNLFIPSKVEKPEKDLLDPLEVEVEVCIDGSCDL